MAKEMGASYAFICYARQEQDFVIELCDNLKNRGISVWLDQWDIPSGKDWDLAIDDAIYGCSSFVIILSPLSIDSNEVRSELRLALDENKLIVPLLYKPCRIPRRLKLIQYTDLTSCGPNDKAALEHVLKALGKIEAIPPKPEAQTEWISLRFNRQLTLEKNEPEKVKVTITILPSGKSYLIGIPVNWTIERLLGEFKKKTGTSDVVPMLATLRRTNKDLDPSSTIEKEEIVDGDDIILRLHCVGG